MDAVDRCRAVVQRRLAPLFIEAILLAMVEFRTRAGSGPIRSDRFISATRRDSTDLEIADRLVTDRTPDRSSESEAEDRDRRTRVRANGKLFPCRRGPRTASPVRPASKEPDYENLKKRLDSVLDCRVYHLIVGRIKGRNSKRSSRENIAITVILGRGRRGVIPPRTNAIAIRRTASIRNSLWPRTTVSRSCRIIVRFRLSYHEPLSFRRSSRRGKLSQLSA